MAHSGHVRPLRLDHSLLRMKSFVCACLAVVSLCHLSAAARGPSHGSSRGPSHESGRTPEARAESPRQLAYRFDFTHPGRVHVSLET